MYLQVSTEDERQTTKQHLNIQHEQQQQHSTEEILAQSTCTALGSSRGLTGAFYAVGRQCSDSDATCDEICTSMFLCTQDKETIRHRWECYGAYHIYNNRPSTNSDGMLSTATLGLKIRSETCGDLPCGPNFCCCRAYWWNSSAFIFIFLCEYLNLMLLHYMNW